MERSSKRRQPRSRSAQPRRARAGCGAGAITPLSRHRSRPERAAGTRGRDR